MIRIVVGVELKNVSLFAALNGVVLIVAMFCKDMTMANV